MGPTRSLQITATGNVTGAADGGMIRSVTLTPAAAAATLTIEGPSGVTLLKLSAPANGPSAQARFDGLAFGGQLVATLAGAGAEAFVEV